MRCFDSSGRQVGPRRDLERLASQGVMSARFSGRLVRLGGKGHYLLEDIRGPTGAIPHVWLNVMYSSIPAPLGSMIQFWADIRRYHRRDGSVDYGLTGAREVRVLEAV